MTASNVPITVEQGATFNLGFTWHEPDSADPTEPGDPHDLTGWTARMQIRKNRGTALLAEATTDDDSIQLGGATGRVGIKLSATQTNAIEERSAKYDLELVNPDGDVFRLLEGKVTINPNITQDA